MKVANSVKDFFQVLSGWKTGLDKHLLVLNKTLAIARTKPVGSHHNANLYMDECGNVWERDAYTWYTLERSSDEPYAEYTRTPMFECGRELCAGGSVQSIEKPDGSRVTFEKRSCDYEHEDWGWYIEGKERQYRKRFSTTEYYESCVSQTINGISLAQTLLEKQSQIGEWMCSYAKDQGDFRLSTSASDEDWDTMIEKFAQGHKYARVPDRGPLLCALHMVLDQLALGRQVREYGY